MNTNRLWSRWQSLAPYFLSVARIAAAFLFLVHGTSKLFGSPMAAFPNGGTAPTLSLMWIAGILESVGGSFLLVGLFTRPIAFLLSGEMAIAYFKAHAPHGFWPLVNHGELAALYAFVWLYLSAAGAGPWSLDALRRSRRSG
jgi:putative oxidoreductase